MRAAIRTVLVITLAWISAANAAAMVVGTYNIRYDSKGDAEAGNGWAQRAPVVASLIQFHQFEVLGVQEALVNQLKDLEKLLPDFAYTGVGRDDGEEKGEFSAIFYRKDKFRVLESGTFWLSETPELAGSKGWDAALPRICTWAKLEPIDGGKSFFVFNVHFDHQGVEARLESARMMVKKTREMAGDDPMILMGDFNVDQNSEGYRELVGAEILTDAFEAAAIRYALNGTANAFNANGKTESRIDHVFLSKHFKPVRYGVLTDTYRGPVTENSEEKKSGNFPGEVKFQEYQARLPSDHFPVLVEVEF